MSTTVVDEKVVSMQFDNRHFEKNVSTSMTTLDKLKEKLSLRGSYRAAQSEFEAYQSGFFNLKDSINKMWSMWEYEIAGKMKSLVSSFTLDPVKTGLSEYETQLNSVQTILANTKSKGSTLEDVNKALDELNKYADQTIYNFTEMTRNIGTFTAAGVELDSSVSAIKGIANLAAVSGSTSQQASTAMYQLSQALSTGTVRLMDWNSVVNAGMGGEVFQNALKATARAHGVAVDEIIKKQGSFRESLQEGWLTSEILTETLNNFTLAAEKGTAEWDEYKASLMEKGYTSKQAEEILEMANTATEAATKVKTFTQLIDVLKESSQSGWAQSWEIIVGDFEEAKDIWTAASDELTGILNKMADVRNKILSGTLSSGWDKLLSAGIMDEKGFSNYLEGMAKTSDIYDDLMAKTNGGKGGGTWAEALQLGIKDGTITTDMLKTSLNSLSKEYDGLNDKQLKNKGYTKEQVKALRELNEGIQNGSISMEDFYTVMQKQSGKELIVESIKNIYNSIKSLVKPIKQAFNEIFMPLTPEGTVDYDKVSEKIYGILEKIRNGTAKVAKFITDNADQIKRTFKGLFAVVDIFLTLGKTIINIVGRIFGKMTGLGGGILNVTASMGDMLVQFSELIKSSDTLAKVSDKIVGFFGNIIDSVKEFINKLKEDKDTSFLDGFIIAVKKVWETVKKVFTAIWNFLSMVGTAIKDAISSAFSSENIDETTDVGLTALITGLIAFLVTKVKKFFDVLESLGIKGLVGSFSDLIEGLTGPLKAFQQKIQSEALMEVAKAILILVGSIVVLALMDSAKITNALGTIGILLGMLIGTLFLINKMSQTVNSVKTIESTGGVFKKVTNVKEAIMTSGKNTAQTIKMVGSLVGLATAVFILAAALKKVSDLEWAEIGRGLVAITGCMAILLATIAALRLIDKIGKNKVSKSISQINKIAISLVLLSIPLKMLGKMTWKEIGRGLVAMAGVMVNLAGMLAILHTVSKISNKCGKEIKGLTKIVMMLSTMATIMAILGQMEWITIAKGLVAMTGCLATLLSTLVALAGISKIQKNVNTQVVALLKISTILLLLSQVIKILGSMAWDQIAKGLVAMTGMLTVLLVTLTWLSKIKSRTKMATEGAKELLKISIVLLVLSASLKIIGTMNWKQIALGIGAMSGMMAVLLITLTILSKIKSRTKMATQGAWELLKLSGSLLVLAVSLKILGSMSWSDIAKGLVTMTVALGVLVGALAIMSKTKGGGSFISSATGLLLMASALLVLAPAIALLGSLDVSTIAKGLGAIGGALLIFGLAGYALQPVAPTLTMIAGALALFGVACVAVGAGIMMLSAGLSTLVTLAVTSGSTVIAVFTALVKSIISMIPEIIVAIGQGLIALCVVIGESAGAIGEALCAVLLAALATLETSVPAMAESLLKILVGILESVSNFIPDIVDKLMDIIIGVLNGIVERIPELVQIAVNAVMALFQGVVDALASIDTSVIIEAIAGIGLLSGLMLALSAIAGLVPGAMLGVAGMGAVIAELALVLAAIGALSKIPGLADFVADGGEFLQIIGNAIGKFIGGIVGGVAEGVTSSLPAMATDLSNFMINLQPFLDGLKQLDEGVLTNGQMLAETLLVITAANLLSQLTSWITGGADMVTFAVQLAAFGKGIKDFANATAGIDPETVKAASEAGKNLGEMAKNVPTTGGLWDWIAGSNDLEGFASQIASFGVGIKNFAKQTKSIDAETVKGAAEAGKTLAQMAKEVPTSGGLWDLIAGSNDLGGFATDITSFGTAISGFAKKVKGINTETVKGAAEAGKTLAQMASTIPTTGGLWGLIAGDNSLSDFAESITDFGEGIANFYNKVKDVVTNKMSGAITQAENMATLLSDMPSDIKDGASDFYDAAKKLGQGIAKFIKEAGDTSKASTAISNIKNLTDSMKNVAGDMATAFTDKLKSFKQNAEEAGNAIAQAANSGVGDKANKTAMTTNAENLVKAFVDGIEDNTDDAGYACSDMARAAAEYIVDWAEQDFYEAGCDMVAGFADGISTSVYKAEAKAAAMAAAAAAAAREELDIHSPSRVAYQIGDYFGVAFITAIEDYEDKAYNSSANMAASAKDGLQKAISKISDLIDMGIDTQPTIRPVLDLSAVAAGAGSINDMFGTNPSVGVMARVNAASSSMNNRQNGKDYEVISAINDLKDSLSGNAGNTYNINGVTYDNGSELQAAIETIIRAAKVERRR